MAPCSKPPPTFSIKLHRPIKGIRGLTREVVGGILANIESQRHRMCSTHNLAPEYPRSGTWNRFVNLNGTAEGNFQLICTWNFRTKYSSWTAEDFTDMFIGSMYSKATHLPPPQYGLPLNSFACCGERCCCSHWLCFSCCLFCGVKCSSGCLNLTSS